MAISIPPTSVPLGPQRAQADPATRAGEPRVHWARAAIMQVGFLAFAGALVVRAAKVQLLERTDWRTRATAQQVAATPLPAPRGTILDVNGAILVESRQLVKLNVAPREVAATVRKRGDGATRVETLTRGLARVGVAPEWIARVRDTSRAWVAIPGRFLATDVASITRLRGVHATPAMERVPPANDGLRRLIGRSNDAGGAVDGIERSLDALLRGTSGRDALLRDARGQRIRSPDVAPDDPVPGHTVTLTINQGLQDIAERALADAVATMRADGGDVVVLDPQTGEVRAMASSRTDPRSAGATALTEPYEPGSTLKPFVAARLLDMGRARADEVVNTHNGTWMLGQRKIVDDHPLPQMSLTEVIQYSSNIGIVQFAQRLNPAEEFGLLRDLGFGAPTGIPYPVEATGTLRSPKRWDGLTASSMAMGYAVTVTPLQLAAAYGAIANGGELLEPALVREIRTPDGDLKFRHSRRVVRRVMSPESARALREMMRGVVESGTAVGSNLSTFDVAGKTGTAKRVENGRYADGKYTASFVGMFPADNPQLVILVKLDNPTKSIYGGRAAAPVSKVVLQAALAARDAALDRATLQPAARALAAQAPAADSGARTRGSEDAAGTALGEQRTGAGFSRPADVRWVADLRAARQAPQPAPSANVTVPDVRGLPVRRAVEALHRAGFRVTLATSTYGADVVAKTAPAAGTTMALGARVSVSGTQ
ncbi:MAG: PASTA domain-containing protein [Gemmatimonadetes bacterium]|nr:PASTA domain-containing protein [Gemmatimonadota bacterium]